MSSQIANISLMRYIDWKQTSYPGKQLVPELAVLSVNSMISMEYAFPVSLNLGKQRGNSVPLDRSMVSSRA